jgi:putative transposase
MSDYRHGSHTVFSIHLHIVWITKYRRKVLRGEIAERVREIVREECRKSRVEILRGHIAADHVHLMVSIPPQVTIRRLIQRMKGKSSYLLFNEFPSLRKRFWGWIYDSAGLVSPSVIVHLACHEAGQPPAVP